MSVPEPVAGNNSSRSVARHMGPGGLSTGMMEAPSRTNTSSMNIVIGEHNDQCSIAEVETATAILSLWGNLITGVLGAIMIPVWGRLSDRYGRVKALAAASTMTLVSQVIDILIAVLPDVFHINWIYLGFLFEGLSGTFILIMALGSAYAGDCTPISQRSVIMGNLGLLHGSMYFGMAVGPVLGGLIGMSGGESRPLVIFGTALAMNTLGVVYILLVVPESLCFTDGKSSPSILPQGYGFSDFRPGNMLEFLQRINPIRGLRSLTLAETSSNPPVRRNLIHFAAVNTLVFATAMSGMNIMMLYPEYIFKWDNQASGVFLSSINIARTTALVLLLPLATWAFKRFVTSAAGPDSLDLLLIRISIFAGTIGYIGYAIAPTGALFTLAGIIASLDSISLAVSEAALSKFAGRENIGEVLGALGFLQASARILGPTIANLIYSQTIQRAPNLVFWGFSVILVIAGFSTFASNPGRRSNVSNEETSEDEIDLEGYSSLR
ncbi:hypothetical protein BP6252_10885 [Coleophoma cylindrospora]|uniref:Major facilitator superfamily (MFS) profile domain-containing protein n=1 Tax=Coleophoma cylindrospora TaxID=1849047 RepID=A0A3D8QNX6_9HELO|nr:hypothetical protein BP6252_10885 [Coleophoma cylindrospora]